MYEKLCRIIPAARLLTNECMAKHNSFKIGGSADVYVLPESISELCLTVSECRREGVPFLVLGHGTNILVPDEGIRGVVIQLYPHMSECRVMDDGLRIRADGGTLLSAAASTAYRAGLTGLEFASGIPGTVGGAVFMNAGAYGEDISGVCESVDVLTREGEIVTVPGEEMGFGYRESLVKNNGGVIVSAVFALKRGEAEDIRRKTDDLNARRRASQPLELPSAGSTFKRPPGYFAGKLIADCGLKGFSIGGAQVSEKHAGFIVNTGGATAEDVLLLMQHIRRTVQNEFGVVLEPEVRLLEAVI